jgi:transposase-like protein
MNKRKSFSAEFKLEAVRALAAGKKPATELARELGIPRNQLYQWRAKYQASAEPDTFPGKGRRTGDEEKLAALQRENERLKEENEILKKAALYFAKECP